MEEAVKKVIGEYESNPPDYWSDRMLEFCISDMKCVLDAIEEKRYHEEDERVTWEECSLRTWLNDTFLNQAFTKEEQEAIILSELYNDFFEAGFEYDQGDTKDKVFLLSTGEWIRGFWGGPGYDPLPEPEYRDAISVPCGKCAAVNEEEGGADVNYWLRTGEVVDSCECWPYDDCYDVEYFVRPVLWLDQSKAEAFIKVAHEGEPASYYR